MASCACISAVSPYKHLCRAPFSWLSGNLFSWTQLQIKHKQFSDHLPVVIQAILILSICFLHFLLISATLYLSAAHFALKAESAAALSPMSELNPILAQFHLTVQLCPFFYPSTFVHFCEDVPGGLLYVLLTVINIGTAAAKVKVLPSVPYLFIVL